MSRHPLRVPNIASPHATCEYSWTTPPVPAHDPGIRARGGRIRAPGRRPLLQCPVRPVTVVGADILANDEPQVPLAGDQQPVQALAAGAGDPPFRDSIRARSPDGRLDDPDPSCREDGVKCRGEFGVPVSDQELQPVRVVLDSRFFSRFGPAGSPTPPSDGR
jgi:hypothetical protein